MAETRVRSQEETAFEEIGVLVQTFLRNEKHFKTPKYSEAQARKDFVDKLGLLKNE